MQAQVYASYMFDRIWDYTYDAAGRQTFQLDPLGAVTERRYDAFGQLAATVQYALKMETSRGSYAIQYVVQYSDPAQNRLARYYYDNAGNLAYSVNPLGYVTRADYDGVGHRIATTDYALAIASTTAATLDAVRAALVTNAEESERDRAFLRSAQTVPARRHALRQTA